VFRNSLLASFHLTQSRSTRVIGALLLLVIGVGLIGIPLPSRKVLETSEKFPCMTCPCGCKTAAKCWDTCCCFTDSEKLEWANRNGVTPPSFLIDRVAAKTSGKVTLACCAAKATKAVSSCCSTTTNTEPKTRSCCAARSKAGCPGNSASCDADTAQDVATGLVLLIAYNECQGIADVWDVLSHGWVPIKTTLICCPEPLLHDSGWPLSESSSGLSYSPDPPVPWRFSRRVTLPFNA
jgi:hypothetical protein